MELLRAKKKLEALKKEHQKLSSQVQKHSIFKNYLEDVVKISPQFEDIQDVISRYKLLVRTRKDLQQSQEKDREMMEQAKVLLDQYEAEKAAEILQCRNELEQLQRRFAQAQSDVRFWAQGRLAQTLPLEFSAHKFQPENWVLVKSWKETEASARLGRSISSSAAHRDSGTTS
ncbi:coiled-coil domain-containing protein 42-like isoform X4 [Patagioenas fasciata]|uniref:coiled-coil domain-containing protein 42-like isoform X4 n=1 Tax=Patagioenas fasciata TaxID=372321 RepID=UPI003A9A35DD